MMIPEQGPTYEPEPKFVYKPAMNLDDHSIVEKLQKMTREELLEFVNQATDEEKEKIIQILNSVVEEDSKPEEEKAEMVDPNAMHDQGNMPGQMPYQPPMGMNQPYGQYYGNQYMGYQPMGMQRGMNPQQGQYGMYMPQQGHGQGPYRQGGYNPGGVC